MGSEAFLESLIERSPHCIWISDDKGALVRINQACRDLFQIKDEMVAKPHPFWDGFIEAQGLLPMIRRVFKDGKTARFCSEYDSSRIRGLDAAERVFLVLDVTVSPVSDPEGRVTHAMIQYADITEGKRAEELLRESESKYRSVFEATGAATTILEEDTTISLANAEFEKLSGYSRAEIEGKKKWTDFVAPEDLARMKEYHYARRKGGAPGHYEFRFLDRRGDVKNIFLTVALIAGTRKSVASLLDITERKRAEEAARESEETAKRLAMENEVVAEIGRIITSTLNIEDVYESFAEEAKRIIHFDRIAVNIFNPDEKKFFIPYVSGLDVPGYRKGDSPPISEELLEKARRVRPGWISQISAEREAQGEEELKMQFPSFLPHYRAGIRSIMAIPLISNDQLMGSLNFLSLKFKAYSQSDLRVAEKIANQIAGAVTNAHLFQKQKRMEEELSQSNERYRRLIEFSPFMISVQKQGKYVYLNPAALKALGASRPEDLAGKSIFEVIHPDYWDAARERLRRVEQGMAAPLIQEKCIRLDQKVIDVELSQVQVFDQNELVILVIARDITEQKKAEKEKALLQERLQQAQKVEAIGTLAGGIAHDFNNILAAILGYAELASLDIPNGSKAKYNLQNSIKSAHRAKELVQQILAFGRQGIQERKPLSVQPIVKESVKFLRASLPATIEIRLAMEEPLGTIEANPTQIHQVLVNLCTNAAQAMGKGGGKLEISLGNVDMKEGISASLAGIGPGPYLRLRVSDTGHGMPPEVLARIFDPYFTTKEVGKGTGLGLAVVHGIVKGYGGGIAVSSEAGTGSTFDVYFPRVEVPNSALESGTVEPLPLGGHERVLFVDDEKAIVETGQNLLEHLGYEAVACTSSVNALELFREKADQFDLVITDMTMPGMTGEELAREILGIRPGMPIILCTGFSEYMSAEKAKALGIREFVLKPLVMMDLAKAVRKSLDSGEGKKKGKATK